MRILYFSRDYTTHDWRFLDKLSQTSHGVGYLRLERGGHALEDRPLPKSVESFDLTGHGGPRGLLRQMVLVPALRRIFREFRPDLVHAGPVQSCGLLTAVSSFRPLLLMSWGRDLLLDADRNAAWLWATRYTLKRSEMLIADSEVVKEKAQALVNYPSDRVVMFPWGIDLGSFSRKSEGSMLRTSLGWEGKTIVISTRSWSPIYGTETIVLGFARALRSVPDLRLILMGDGPLKQEILELIENHGLGDFIHLPGQVSYTRLPDFFNAADIYASATHTDGTSISLLEAMACGLPAVVSDIKGNREWVAHGINGWLAKPDDVPSMEGALRTAARSKEAWPTIAEANRKVVEDRANWDKNFELLLQAYERTIGLSKETGN